MGLPSAVDATVRGVLANGNPSAADAVRSGLERAIAFAQGALLPRAGALLRLPAARVITALAASDVAYRLLLRESLRRALGMRR
jgi:hypothetical protein